MAAGLRDRPRTDRLFRSPWRPYRRFIVASILPGDTVAIRPRGGRGGRGGGRQRALQRLGLRLRPRRGPGARRDPRRGRLHRSHNPLPRRSRTTDASRAAALLGHLREASRTNGLGGRSGCPTKTSRTSARLMSAPSWVEPGSSCRSSTPPSPSLAYTRSRTIERPSSAWRASSSS